MRLVKLAGFVGCIAAFSVFRIINHVCLASGTDACCWTRQQTRAKGLGHMCRL